MLGIIKYNKREFFLKSINLFNKLIKVKKIKDQKKLIKHIKLTSKTAFR